MKRALIAAAVLFVLVASVFVARWLNNDSTERSQVTELLRAQARGDAEAMLAILRCPDPRASRSCAPTRGACARPAT